jgi:hypothetical protein
MRTTSHRALLRLLPICEHKQSSQRDAHLMQTVCQSIIVSSPDSYSKIALNRRQALHRLSHAHQSRLLLPQSLFQKPAAISDICNLNGLLVRTQDNLNRSVSGLPLPPASIRSTPRLALPRASLRGLHLVATPPSFISSCHQWSCHVNRPWGRPG